MAQEVDSGRRVWELGAPARASAYLELIDWAATHADFASVVWPELLDVPPRARRVLDDFEEAGSEAVQTDVWPGNGTLGTELVTRYIARITPELRSAIRQAASELGEWVAPHLPTDLHFLRADRSVLLGNVASHHMAWLDIDDAERSSIPQPLAAVLQLREPEGYFLFHSDPAWSERGNVVVFAASHYNPADRESLWCRRLTDERYEVCCIPFNIRDLALGDEIDAQLDATGDLVMTGIANRRGHRVDLVNLVSLSYSAETFISDMEALGGLVEVAGPSWIALDKSAEVLEDEDPLEARLDALLERGVIELW